MIDGIVVHEDIAGQHRWPDRLAIRKDSPELKTVVNGFVKSAKKGTLPGNILLKKYPQSTEWIKDALADSDPAIAPLDQELFSFAAYNAGPGNIAKAREKAAAMGFDPNGWFQNVEFAAAKVISRWPVRLRPEHLQMLCRLPDAERTGGGAPHRRGAVRTL